MNIGDSALRLKPGKRIKGEQFSYRVGELIGRGGSGVVYRASCVETQGDVAIKFFLPLYEINLSLFESSTTQQRALDDLANFFRKELQCLREIHHPSIVRILDNGIYHPSKGELIRQLEIVEQLNFFVMNFITGHDISAYLSNNPPKTEVISVLSKLCDALVYLHEVKEYLHADIRSPNILVRDGTAEPVIIDFALYKNFNFHEANPDDITRLYGDWDLFPKDISTDHQLKKLKETGGTRKELKSQCFPGIDLFQLGKLLRALRGQLTRIFSTEEVEFLDLIEQELLSWERVKNLKARWLRDQLSKLDPAYSQFMGVEELTPPSSARQTLQLPAKVVTISPLIDRLCNTRSFRRLRSINQLAFIDILYPGAGYRRHLHCLHAYGYCAELIESLTQSPRFRLLFSPSLARQALALSLLHDINHFPLLHIFQEIRGEYIKDIDLLDLFCDGQATQDSPSIYEILEEIHLTRKEFKELLLLSHPQLVERGYGPGLQIVKSMIDSGADVDKLAYLEDDSLFTGVAYGRGVDSARLIASATVVRAPASISMKQGWHLGFREQALSAVESLVMARFWMFRTVYWHRINRAIMAMLLHVIRKLYVEAKANASEFVVDTMWRSEESVLEYLNEKYKKRFGTDSITHLILKDRSKVYDKLFSVQGASHEGHESALYDAVANLEASHLQECRKNLRKAVEDYLRTQFHVGFTISDDDLLFDIPGRRLDTAGAIYVELETGEVRSIGDIPGPVQRVVTDFERLAKRMRVFVHPRIADSIGKDALVTKRAELLHLLEQSLPRGAGDQVR